MDREYKWKCPHCEKEFPCSTFEEHDAHLDHRCEKRISLEMKYNKLLEFVKSLILENIDGACDDIINIHYDAIELLKEIGEIK